MQVLEEAIVETLQIVLKDDFNDDVRQSWKKFYWYLHVLAVV